MMGLSRTSTKAALAPLRARISVRSRSRIRLSAALLGLISSLPACRRTVNPRKSKPSSRVTTRVLSSLKARPLGASHSASRALTCAASSLVWHKATRSSAYLITTGESGTVAPACRPVCWYRTRVSTPSGPGTRPVSGQLSETTGGGADHTVPGFLSPFGRQAFASRVIPYPPGDWAFLTVGLPDTHSCPDPDGVTTFHTHKQRPGWVPPIPRGQRCSPGRYRISDRRLPLFHGQPLHPAQTTHQRG